MLLLKEFEPTECREALGRFYRDLSNEVAGVRPPTGDDAWLMQMAQDQMSTEYERGVQHQIDIGQFSKEFREFALGHLGRYGLGGSIPDDVVDELVIGVARAIVEQQKQFRHQLRNVVLPYMPSDPLFAASMASPPVQTELVEGVGPTIDEVIDAFCKWNELKWREKTLSTHRAKLKLLAECFGAHRRFATLTKADLWFFVGGVQRLRRNYHVAPQQSFLSRQTDAVTGRITAVTVTNILARIKSLFRWARERGYREDNPAEFLSVAAPKQQKGEKSRRSFKPHELTSVFSSPLFTGSKSASRRFEPGAMIIKDAYYWVPLLSYFTGARLGELVQLGFDDLILDNDAPHISINENNSPPGEKKHVKTEAGVRLIPIHPELIDLGFREFVSQRRKVRGKRVRLFWDIAYGADGQASTTFSKWWGRAMDKMGLGDSSLTFHSFRHTAEDFYKTSMTPKYLIDQIMGHSDQTSAGDYGVGVDIGTAYDIVRGLKLPVSLAALLGSNGDA